MLYTSYILLLTFFYGLVAIFQAKRIFSGFGNVRTFRIILLISSVQNRKLFEMAIKLAVGESQLEL